MIFIEHVERPLAEQFPMILLFQPRATYMEDIHNTYVKGDWNNK